MTARPTSWIEIVPGAVWAHERTVWFKGVRLRARTTVLRLESGELLLYGPAAPTDELVATLAELGPVRYLVVPNLFHHLEVPEAAARYPDALVLGPRAIESKHAGVRLTHAFEDGPGADVAAWSELAVVPLAGIPFLSETALFHRPTGTLIGADLALSACAHDHWTWRWAASFMGCYERLRLPPDVTVADPAAARKTLDGLLALPIERLVVAHADVVDDRPAERLAEAWERRLAR